MPENGSGNDIDHLQISIEASAAKAASGIDKLATALSKLSAAAIPIKGSLFSDLADGLKPLAELKLSSVGSTIRAIVMLSKNVGDLENLRDIDPTVLVTLAEALRTLEGIKLSGIGTVLREVRQIPETLEKLSKVDIDQYAEKLQALTAALEPLALHAKEIVGAFTAIGKTTIKIYPDGASVNEQQKKAVEKATFDYSRLGRVLSTLAKPFNKAASAAGNFLKKLGSRVIHAFTGRIERLATGVHRLFNSIRRVVLMRAIRAVLREITAGFKEGIDNLYQWSALVDGRFKASMDKIATSMLYLKNSIAAMVSPIINRLAPAIDWLVDRFVDLLNIINQVFSALTGSDTWTKAIKYPVEYAEGMADAAKSTKEAAKELKLFLLPFDELNVLTKDNPADTSTPGSAGQGGLNYAEMFETRELEDWAKKIKDLIDQGDWYGAGAALAEHLNGIIEQWDSYEWGRILAEKLNHAISFALGFMRTFDWQNLGTKVSQYLRGIIENLNWEDLGALLASKWNALFGFLGGFFKDFNGKDLGDKLSKLFNAWVKEINWEQIGEAINDGINDLLDIAIGFLEGADLKGLNDGIEKMLSKIDWKGIMGKLWDIISDALEKTWNSGGMGKIATVLGGLIAALDVVGGIVKWIPSIVKLIELLGGGGTVTAGAGAAGAAGAGAAGAGASAGAGAAVAAGGGLAGALGSVGIALAAIVAIGGQLALTYILVKQEIERFRTSIEYLKKALPELKEKWQPVIDWLGKAFEGAWIIVKAAWIVASTWFNEKVIQPIAKLYNNVKEKIVNFLTEAWNKVKPIWGAVATWFNANVISPLVSAFNAAATSISNVFSSVFGFIRSLAASVINGVIGTIEGGINNVISGLNWLIGIFNQVVQVAAAYTGDSYSGLGQIGYVNLGRVDSGVDTSAAYSAVGGSNSNVISDMADAIRGAIGGDRSQQIDVTVELDGQKVGKSVVNYVNDQTIANGQSPMLAY